MKVPFLLLLLTLFSCSGKSTSQSYRLPKIGPAEIEIAEIKKGLYDTMAVQLNEQQISKFVAIVNDSPTEMRKAMLNYWIFVRLKNDSVILYKILDHYIGERDAYVKTNQAAYFKGLYEKSRKMQHLISIR